MLSFTRRSTLGAALLTSAAGSPPALAQAGRMQSWKLATSRRTGIHDVVPAPDGGVWLTAQAGYVGRVAVKTGQVSLKPSPRGCGPYGICSTPGGEVWLPESGTKHISVIRTA